MIRLLCLTVAFCSLAGCGGGSAPAAVKETIQLASGTATLRATITAVKVDGGEVYCAFFNAEAGFPGASPIIGGNRTVAPNSVSVVCELAQIPAGTYALIVFQDEDGNGQLDSNAFGAPTEGYGASNNKLPATSAPTFKDSSVAVADGATVDITINLKH